MTEYVGWAGRQGRPSRADSCKWSCPKSLCFWCPERRFPVTVVLQRKGCLDRSGLASQAPGHVHHPVAFTGAGTLLLAPIPTPHLPLPCLAHGGLTLQLRCPGFPLGWPLAGGRARPCTASLAPNTARQTAPTGSPLRAPLHRLPPPPAALLLLLSHQGHSGSAPIPGRPPTLAWLLRSCLTFITISSLSSICFKQSEWFHPAGHRNGLLTREDWCQRGGSAG